MKRIKHGDIIAIKINNIFYYAFILDKIKLFGGNWTYVLHYTSNELHNHSELLENNLSGFHAFVDFINAKRENRIFVISRNNDFAGYNKIKHLKAGIGIDPLNPKAWQIMDLEFNDIKRVRKLNKKQIKYPYATRIDYKLLAYTINLNN